MSLEVAGRTQLAVTVSTGIRGQDLFLWSEMKLSARTKKENETNTSQHQPIIIILCAVRRNSSGKEESQAFVILSSRRVATGRGRGRVFRIVRGFDTPCGGALLDRNETGSTITTLLACSDYRFTHSTPSCGGPNSVMYCLHVV